MTKIKAKENSCCQIIFFFSTDNSVDVPVTDIAMVYFIDIDLRVLWRN